MKIKRDGIYKTIDSKDFGIFQKSGWEKVVVEPIAQVVSKPKPEPEPIKEEVKVEEESEPIKEEIIPKSKKKKKA